jgi:hypothetical protein
MSSSIFSAVLFSSSFEKQVSRMKSIRTTVGGVGLFPKISLALHFFHRNIRVQIWSTFQPQNEFRLFVTSPILSQKLKNRRTAVSLPRRSPPRVAIVSATNEKW